MLLECEDRRAMMYGKMGSESGGVSADEMDSGILLEYDIRVLTMLNEDLGGRRF